MEPLDFLRTVLPSPGHGLYCAFNAAGKNRWNVFFENIEELTPFFGRMVDREVDTYFGLATFELPPETEKGKGREAENARYMRSLFIDMDGYESPRAAWNTLRAFLEELGLLALGKPYLVTSGGGLHAYWPFKQDVDIATWEPIAKNFKRLCRQEKLKIDTKVTADAARVLRCPGTINFKKNDDGEWKYGSPQRVGLVREGDTFDHVELGEAIAAKLTGIDTEKPSSVLHLPGQRIDTSGVEMELGKSEPSFFHVIERKTDEGSGCAQLKFYKDNASGDGMEPLWRSILSIAKFCEDGWDHAVRLTEMHPYPADKLKDRWQRIEGPHFCKTFDDTNPGVCQSCPHWAKPKFTTPIILGREVQTHTESSEVEKEVEVTSDVEATTRLFIRPEPPKGFSYDEHGGVWGSIKDKKGKDHSVRITAFPLYVASLLQDPTGAHGAQFIAEHPMGDRTFELKAKVIGSKDECIKLLMENLVTPERPAYAQALHEYVWACYADATRERRAMQVPSHYGWQDDGSFVFAGKIFRKDQPPLDVPMQDLENLLACTRPKGSLQKWQEFMRTCVIAKRLTKHAAAFVMGTAAPLMRFTPQAGMTVHLCSADSGTGKSLTLGAISSVWGHPTEYRVGQGTSPVTMKQRLGHLHSLPLTVDEISEQTRKDPEWFANHLLSMTDGKGKERMESGTNKERLNLTSWRSVSIMTSNTKALDFLTLGRRHTAKGELHRLIELRFDEEIKWTDLELAATQLLDENFGVAGYKLAQWLVDNIDKLPGYVKEGCAYARLHFKMVDRERYWNALVGCAIAMMRILAEADILRLPMPAILKEFGQSIERMREEISGTDSAPEDTLWEYMSQNNGQLVVMKAQDKSKVAELGIALRNREQELSSGKLPIMGRVEIDTMPGWVDIYIPSNILRKHCHETGVDASEFLTKLQNSGKFTVQRQARPDMLAGTKFGNMPNMRPACVKISTRTTEVDAKSGLSVETG